MHSVYVEVLVGSLKSVWVVAAPLIHFHTSLSLASSVLFFTNRSDLAAVRQPISGDALHWLDRQLALFSSQNCGAQGSPACVQTPDWHVSAPSQKTPLSHDESSGCSASAGQSLFT